MAEINSKAEAEAVADVVQELARPRLLDLKRGDDTGAAVLILPTGQEAQSLKPFLDEYRTAPERRKGTARLATLDSFIEHAKRFADPDSVVFADAGDQPKLVSVLDYHRATAEGAPRFGEHRGVYTFPLSEAWRTWKQADKKQMGQADFAAFIETRVSDFLEPGSASPGAKAVAGDGSFAGSAKLLELAQGLHVRVGSTVKQAVNLGTGESQIQFVTEHMDETGKPLRVPGLFLLGIPVFDADVAYQVPVRLRYRAKDGGLVWWFELHRPEVYLRDAIDGAVVKVRQATGLPVLYGTPEA